MFLPFCTLLYLSNSFILWFLNQKKIDTIIYSYENSINKSIINLLLTDVVMSGFNIYENFTVFSGSSSEIFYGIIYLLGFSVFHDFWLLTLKKNYPMDNTSLNIWSKHVIVFAMPWQLFSMGYMFPLVIFPIVCKINWLIFSQTLMWIYFKRILNVSVFSRQENNHIVLSTTYPSKLEINDISCNITWLKAYAALHNFTVKNTYTSSNEVRIEMIKA